MQDSPDGYRKDNFSFSLSLKISGCFSKISLQVRFQQIPALISSKIRSQMGLLLLILMYLAVWMVRFRVLVRMVKFSLSYQSFMSWSRAMGKVLAYLSPFSDNFEFPPILSSILYQLSPCLDRQIFLLGEMVRLMVQVMIFSAKYPLILLISMPSPTLMVLMKGKPQSAVSVSYTFSQYLILSLKSICAYSILLDLQS